MSYTEVPDTIQSNDTFEVKVNVKNEGDVTVGKKLELQIDGQTTAAENVRVGPGDTKEVSLSYDKLFETGDYEVSINDLNSKTITVTEKKPTFEYSDLEVTPADQAISATATVTNYGTYEGTAHVPLSINGETVDSKQVEVSAEAGGGSKEVTFTYQTPDEAGVYETTIGDLEEQLAALPAIDLSGTWLFKKGDDSRWKDVDFDDSEWQEVILPSSWEDHSDYTEDYVYGWYRKTIDIPAEWEGYSLKVKLGKIDDVDATYFNGEKIAQSGEFPTGEGEDGMLSAWDWEREYEIPADAIEFGQENVISIRVFDASGGGGLYEGPLDPIEVVKKQ
ncbi:hypothetical protein ACE1TI_12110 [Alteribacillus sp. JSM 102045]|uniref:COG1470 family protein n=1 Tax=Alteribacillus sp. JSM 102045 TaxID=1562101 RepID=UPI0035BECC18